MPVIRNLKNIPFVAILLFVCSCATYKTIEFTEGKKAKPTLVNEWTIEPDIYSIRRSAGKFTQEQLESFVVKVSAVIVKDAELHDLLDIDFENVSVNLKPSNEIIPISLNYICCVSYPSDKFINKKYSYNKCISKQKLCSIIIPEDIDTVVLKFDAVFYNGVLSSKEDLSVIWDHIIVNDSTPVERIPIEIEMYRKLSSYKGIYYGD